MFFKKDPTIDPDNEHRDWLLVAQIADNALNEQRKARRWGIFFKTLTFTYLFVLLIAFVVGAQKTTLAPGTSSSHTAVVKVNGVIAADEQSNANAIVGGLRRAFANENAKAVMLAINSPGGSPVQSGYVYDEIVRLREQYPDKKLYAVISDLGASGGYYMAAAADEIYADKASLVGSIGVTASGFGFVDIMEKIGVERRHFTAGEHKAFLDPFSPVKADEKQFWKQVLANTHQQFIDVVKRGRGDRLKETDDMFSGLIWNGEQALELGLIDGLGSAGFVARDIIGASDLVDYSFKPSPLDELTRKFGIAVGSGIAQMIGIDRQPIELH